MKTLDEKESLLKAELKKVQKKKRIKEIKTKKDERKRRTHLYCKISGHFFSKHPIDELEKIADKVEKGEMRIASLIDNLCRELVKLNYKTTDLKPEFLKERITVIKQKQETEKQNVAQAKPAASTAAISQSVSSQNPSV